MHRSGLLMAGIVAATAPLLASATSPTLTLTPIGVHESGFYAQGGAEITSYDPLTRRAFVVNAGDSSVDVLDLRNPKAPQLVTKLDLGAQGLGAANSVAAYLGLMAVVLEATDRQQPGTLLIYTTWNLRQVASYAVGAQPDMVTFSDDGRYVLVANEGEPSDDYTIDPEGSVTIVDLLKLGRRDALKTADFSAFNGAKARQALVDAGVRIYGPNASVAQDIEPEYIATRKGKAYVTLQENNALAVIDIAKAKVEKILPLGLKDHSIAGNELDPSDRDNAIAIANWPVFGMYQPDAIDAFDVKGKGYLVTANEGDARGWSGYNEEIRVGASGYVLDPARFPNAAALKANAALGRLTVTRASGDLDGDGDFDRIQVLGGRSFSIWSEKGELVYDSGSTFERLLATVNPEFFNASNEDNAFDSRSDNKGPEPEAVAVGEIAGRPYAFVGLERMGGIAVFDLSNPKAPRFVTYANRREFTEAVSLQNGEGETVPNPAAGDLGPEGIKFVPAWASPNWKPLLIVGNEISGTTTIWEISVDRSR